MKRLRILVDLDSTICDTLPYWLAYIEKKTGVKAVESDITEWELEKAAPYAQAVSEGKLDPFKHIYSSLSVPGFHLEIPPMEGALETVKKWQDQGHQVMIVTARGNKASIWDTHEWVKKYMPWVDRRKQLAFIHHKEMLKADVFIDDKLESLVAYNKEWPEAILMAVFFNHNHTREVPVFRPVKRDAWRVFDQVIQAFSE